MDVAPRPRRPRRPVRLPLLAAAPLLLGACLLLAAPLVPATASRAADPDLDGRWVGTLHTLQGRCPDQSSSTLVVNEKELSFAPADGVLVLHGRRTADRSHLHAQLVLPGTNHKPVPMVLQAHPQGRAIVGLYGTPTCRAEITLRRPDEHPLQRALGH